MSSVFCRKNKNFFEKLSKTLQKCKSKQSQFGCFVKKCLKSALRKGISADCRAGFLRSDAVVSGRRGLLKKVGFCRFRAGRAVWRGSGALRYAADIPPRPAIHNCRTEVKRTLNAERLRRTALACARGRQSPFYSRTVRRGTGGSASRCCGVVEERGIISLRH